jgi:hypothetical protein
MTVSPTGDVAKVDLYDSRWMNDTRGFQVVISDASPYASFKEPVFGTDAEGGKYRDALLEWLVEKGLIEETLDDADGETVAAAVKAQGEKLSVKGKPYWAEFIAGTDPDDKTSEFIAKVEMVDGKPVVTWSPDMNDGAGKVGVREYKIWGKEHLDEVNWSEVSDGETENYRFFKVTVDMP